MAQAIDIITRAMKDIGAIASGEKPTPEEAQDALDMLNDMVDQWSNENLMVYNVTEIIFPVIAGQVQYTIGPYASTPNFIGASFTGSITSNILTVSGINSGAVAQGQVITGPGIAEGTKIVGFGTGAGGNVNEVGTYILNISQSVPSTTITAYYQKPLSIDSAFVRINTTSNGQPILNGGLDYPVAPLSLQEYEMIGLKTLNGPWPKALYFNPGSDSGNLYVWPNPSQGEMHIFANTIFSRFITVNDAVDFPQGYSMALRWNLAERLMPMFGKISSVQLSMINAYAAQSKSTIKRTNMNPAQVSMVTDVLLSTKARDAGWILTGGFLR